MRRVWPEQDSQGDADHLQILGASDRLDLLRVCADVVDDGALKVWEFQVPTFLHDIVVFDSLYLVEEEGTMTRLDVVDGGLEAGAENEGDHHHAGGPFNLVHILTHFSFILRIRKSRSRSLT